MKTAFKEWAVVCRALGCGKQVVILRKGGIIEAGGEFKPDHSEFVLFPTYLHQSPHHLAPESRPWLQQAIDDGHEDKRVTLQYYATVTDALQVCSLDAVLQLRGQHVWSDEVVKERFHRWKDSVYVLIVRVHVLPKPVSIELLDDYAGCKSWVDLAVDVSTAGATSVLSDAEFAQREAEIHAAFAGRV